MRDIVNILIVLLLAGWLLGYSASGRRSAASSIFFCSVAVILLVYRLVTGRKAP
jgi:hypothetical protein